MKTNKLKKEYVFLMIFGGFIGCVLLFIAIKPTQMIEAYPDFEIMKLVLDSQQPIDTQVIKTMHQAKKNNNSAVSIESPYGNNEEKNIPILDGSVYLHENSYVVFDGYKKIEPYINNMKEKGYLVDRMSNQIDLEKNGIRILIFIKPYSERSLLFDKEPSKYFVYTVEFYEV